MAVEVDITSDKYHASTGLGENEYITRSMCCDYANSAFGFWQRYVVKDEDAQQDSNKACFKMGNMVEALANGTFSNLFATELENKPERKGVGALERIREWNERNAEHMKGKTFCTPKEIQTAERCIRNLNKSSLIGAWVMSRVSRHGKVIRWTDEETGLPLQVMFDSEVPGKALVDYKTLGKPMRKWSDSCIENGYFEQAALYSHAYRLLTGDELPFMFAVAQTVYPFEAMIYEAPTHAVEAASRRLRQALRGIKNKDWFPHAESRSAIIQELPAYYSFRYENEVGTSGDLL
jgi:hypothetical protein